jgi:HEAT repeat protein
MLKSAAELRQLASRLHDQDPQQAETARKELKRCGLSDVELELARQLVHPDTGVRKSLARALPDTAGIDAAPWLLELSRDADADVRLEAITLLATTGDPALLEQLRSLVQADADERIRRLSDRLFRPATLADKKGATRGAVLK